MEKCSIANALNKYDPTYFPGVYRILKITALFPIMSCKCERSISALRIAKTYLRSTMGQGRLASLALTCAYRNININSTNIALEFSRRKPRLILLPNIFVKIHVLGIFNFPYGNLYYNSGKLFKYSAPTWPTTASVLAVCMSFIIQLKLFLIATLIT